MRAREAEKTAARTREGGPSAERAENFGLRVEEEELRARIAELEQTKEVAPPPPWLPSRLRGKGAGRGCKHEDKTAKLYGKGLALNMHPSVISEFVATVAESGTLELRGGRFFHTPTADALAPSTGGAYTGAAFFHCHGRGVRTRAGVALVVDTPTAARGRTARRQKGEVRPRRARDAPRGASRTQRRRCAARLVRALPRTHARLMRQELRGRRALRPAVPPHRLRPARSGCGRGRGHRGCG